MPDPVCGCGYEWKRKGRRRKGETPAQGMLLSFAAWVELLDFVEHALHYQTFWEEDLTGQPGELFARIQEWAEAVARGVLQCPRCGGLAVEEQRSALLAELPDEVHGLVPQDSATARGLLTRMDESRP